MADVDRRLQLQELLEHILGSAEVHFQPGPNISMHYPAITYSRNNIMSKKADNVEYNRVISYKVTVIDYNPDSEIVEKISQLPFASFNTHYTTSGLNHDVFTIFY